MDNENGSQLAAEKRQFFIMLVPVTIIILLCEFIGIRRVPLAGFTISLLPMLFAVIIGILVTPDALGRLVKPLKKVISMKGVKHANTFVMIALLPLGVKYGTSAGPRVIELIQSGPALLLQELGNLATPLIALPLGLILGLRRELIGATSTICRESSLGVLGDKYGISSPEGTGLLGVYLTGTVLGTIFYSILAPLSLGLGLHPYALAMGCGTGSASMMTASSASLALSADPAYTELIKAYAAASNMLTGVTGLYATVFLALPFTNWYYKKWKKLMKVKNDVVSQ